MYCIIEYTRIIKTLYRSIKLQVIYKYYFALVISSKTYFLMRIYHPIIVKRKVILMTTIMMIFLLLNTFYLYLHFDFIDYFLSLFFIYSNFLI